MRNIPGSRDPGRMPTRRRFLEQLGFTLCGGLLAGPVLAAVPASAAARMGRAPSLAATNAGALRVLPGAALDITIPGVRIESIRLRMPDGVQLAASLYLPSDLKAAAPIPGIVEVLPYRKDDRYLSGDLVQHVFYARHGYAGLRLDVRGTGASEGIPADEYSAEEHEDTLHVIDWLARQRWCSGRIGMTGISYGGFNALQIAALNPPALKAIVAAGATDDRYTDDVHYIGGALHLFENTWAVNMVVDNVLPGAPGYDPRDRAARDRFDAPPWMLRWLHEQTDGPYWRRGSLRPDYGRLRVPALLLGGWLDGYHNFVPRIMRHAPAVTRGLVGPWPHSYPDDAEPGPRIDFRGRFKRRWFDRFLKGKETGILDEPAVTWYAQRWYQPTLRLPDLRDVPGEWRHASSWPASAFEPAERLFLRPENEGRGAAARLPDSGTAGRPGRGGRLASNAGRAAALSLLYRPWVGTASKTWAPDGDGSYGLDQRTDDAWGLSFDSRPLRRSVEIAGFASARLFVSASAPVANWIVRLCDVAPDGTSHYVSKGVLNGTHRRSHTDPEPLVPGQVYELQVELHATAWIFDPGHRIRMVVSNADWPVVWPSPHPMTTVLHCGGDHPSHIDLPVYEGPGLPGPEMRPPPEPAAGEGGERLVDYDAVPLVWQVTREEGRGRTTFRFERGVEMTRHPAGIRISQGQVMVARVDDRDPATASLEVQSRIAVRLPGGRTVEARGEGAIRGTERDFLFDVTCSLNENGRRVRSRRWQDRAPRRLV